MCAVLCSSAPGLSPVMFSARVLLGLTHQPSVLAAANVTDRWSCDLYWHIRRRQIRKKRAKRLDGTLSNFVVGH